MFKAIAILWEKLAQALLVIGKGIDAVDKVANVAVAQAENFERTSLAELNAEYDETLKEMGLQRIPEKK